MLSWNIFLNDMQSSTVATAWRKSDVFNTAALENTPHNREIKLASSETIASRTSTVFTAYDVCETSVATFAVLRSNVSRTAGFKFARKDHIATGGRARAETAPSTPHFAATMP